MTDDEEKQHLRRRLENEKSLVGELMDEIKVLKGIMEKERRQARLDASKRPFAMPTNPDDDALVDAVVDVMMANKASTNTTQPSGVAAFFGSIPDMEDDEGDEKHKSTGSVLDLAKCTLDLFLKQARRLKR